MSAESSRPPMSQRTKDLLLLLADDGVDRVDRAELLALVGSVYRDAIGFALAEAARGRLGPGRRGGGSP